MADERLEDLFLRYRDEGDLVALGRLFDRAQPEMTRVAERLIGHTGLAEDAVQNTFLVVLEQADRFESGRPLMPWLMGILANRAKEVRASQRRRSTSAIGDYEPAAPDAEGTSLDELRSIVERTLADMPAEYRDVLHLNLRHEMAPVDISRVLGRPRGTVRSQLARGLERLRRALPPGIATALLAALMPRRGQAAMRALVLEAASAATKPRLAASMFALGVAAVALLVFAVIQLTTVHDDPSILSADLEAETAVLPRRESSEPETPLMETVSDPETAVASEPAPSENGESASLRVRLVCDGDAVVVPSALIRLFRDRRDEGEHVQRDVVTDGDGVARFEDLPPGRYMAFSDRSRTAKARVGRIDLEPGASGELELKTIRGVDLKGRVVDGRGRPVEGADVWLGFMSDQGGVVAKSRADGAFDLVAVRDGLCLGIRKSGLAPTPVRRLVFPPGTTEAAVEFVMETRAGGVQGTVFDHDGRPYPDVLVMVGRTRGDPHTFADGGQGFGPPGIASRSGPDGRFRVDGVAPGRRTVLVYTRSRATHLGPVDVEAGQVTECDVTLVEGARLSAVVRGADGRPITAASIHLGSFADLTFRSAGVDAEGRATLDGITPGEFTVMAFGPDGRAAEKLIFESGKVTTWEPVFARKKVIRGVLVDVDGKPVAGRGLRALAPGAPVILTNTAEDGRFSFETDVDSLFRVELRGRDGITSEAVVSGVRPGDGPVTLRVDGTMAPTARLRGHVRSSSAETKAAVQLVGVDFTINRRFVVSRADGAFEGTAIVPGRYVACVQREGRSGPWRGPIEIAIGESRDLGDLESIDLVAPENTWAVIRDSVGMLVVVPKDQTLASDPSCGTETDNTKRH